MKSLLPKILLIIATTSWACMTLAQSASDVLETYVHSGDNQDVGSLKQVLHPDFVSNYTLEGVDKIEDLGRRQFLSMFKKKKFGGDTRKLTINSVRESKNLAWINAEVAGEKTLFSGVFIMQRDAGAWKLKEEYLIVKRTN